MQSKTVEKAHIRGCTLLLFTSRIEILSFQAFFLFLPPNTCSSMRRKKKAETGNKINLSLLKF